ncbi:MAG: 3-dehydroquinate synthase [Aggregatilineales bacterium]
METLNVPTPGGEYQVYVGTGLLSQLHGLLAQHKLTGQTVMVTNDTLAPLHGQALADSLGAQLITIPDGETHKTLDTVRTLYDQFAATGLDRHSVVIALGGGVVGDMVGFAAATYLRGLSFVQAPTSLLAMVDASVGGKTGVNLPYGKNLVGVFKQPEFVVADIDLLRTLPEAERRSGLAEIIKHGFIGDPSLLDPAQFDPITPEYVARAIRVKIDIVTRDPFEQHDRAFLNLGHTFAHAIEAVSNYTWRHGEAVAVGLIGAARLSHLHELCGPELPVQVETAVRAAGLPTSYMGYSPSDLRAAMNTDKKRQNGHVRFVLMHGIGDLMLDDSVPDYLVLQTLESLKQE